MSITLDTGDVAQFGYKANGSAVALDPTLTLSDSSGSIDTVTVAIDNPSILTGEDLNFTSDAALYGNITASFDAATAALTLTSAGDTATLAEWQAALQSITYTSTIDPTDGGAYTFVPINWSATDSLSNVATSQSYVDYTPAVIAGNLVGFVPGGSPVVLSPNLLIIDGQSSTITGATVSTFFNFVTGDQLGFTANAAFGNIAGSYNATTGVLTLTSSGDTATVAQWQAALESVTYSFTGTDITAAGATTRDIAWTVTDAASNTLVNDSYIEIARPIITAGATVTFHGGDAAVALDPALTVSELGESVNLASATVKFSGPGFIAGDELNFTNQNGITGSYNAVTGALTLSGPANIANYQTALESVTYSFSPSNADPTNGGGDLSRQITWQATDSGGTISASQTSTLIVDHTPPAITAGATVTLVVGGSPVTLDAGLTVTDPDSGGNLTGATVQIGTPTISGTIGFVFGDTLTFTDQNGITGSYNAATGHLSLTGTASVADYQLALESITYSSTAADPTNGGTELSRTISWLANDGVAHSASASSTVNLDTPPTLTAGATATFDGGGSPVTLDAALTIAGGTQADLTGATLSLGHAAFKGDPIHFLAGDTLSFTNQSGITGAYDAATGVLTMSGTATVADYQTALDSVTYSFDPINGDPTGGGLDTHRTISWQVSDGVASTGDTSTVDTVHVAPSVTAGATTTFVIGSSPVTLDPGLIVSDPDSGGNLTRATVQIGTPTSKDGTIGLVAGDTLTFTNQNGITGVYDAATGELTLTGTASLADYQTALDSIAYSSTATDPTDGGLDLNRTIHWQVDDGVSASLKATSTVNLDVLPTLTAGATATFDGGGSPVTLDGALTIAVGTEADLTGATVRLGLAESKFNLFSHFLAGDTLTFTDQNGITGAYDAATGVLTLTGTASVADYQTALDSVTYSFNPANGDPTGGGDDTTRTISWRVNDGFTSTGATSTLDTVHIAATVTAGANATFTGGGPAVTLDPGLTVVDPDSGGTLTGATVTVGYEPSFAVKSAYFLAGDTLTFTNQNGITGAYDAATGVLTLNGTASVADYQAALDSVTYSFTPPNGDPTAGGLDLGRVVDWQVNDGVTSSDDTSFVDTIHVPATVTAGATAAFVGGGSPVILDAGLAVSDPDSAGNLAGATVTISSGFLSGDTLNFTNQNGIAGSYNAATGVLTLTGVATLAQYQTALESITFSENPGNADPTGGGSDIHRTITWQVNDGAANSAAVASTVNTMHVPPTLAAGGFAFYTGGGPAVALESGLKVSDPDSGGDLVSATIAIGAGFHAGDILGFVNQNGITGSYNAATGVLTLTGMTSLANYQTALESVTYGSTASDPTFGGMDASRAIAWQVNDGAANSNIAASTLDMLHLTPTVSNTTSHTHITLGGGSSLSVYDYSAGGNTLNLGAGAGDRAYVFNGGSDVVTLGAGAHDSVGIFGGPGGNTITLGNGAGDTVFDGASGDVVKLGSGAGDTVTLFYGGGDTVTFGVAAHDVLVDDSLGGNTITFGGTSATLDLSHYGGTSVAPLDVVKGLVAGDKIVLDRSASVDTLVKATHLGGVASEALLATGTYNTATHVFAYGGAGHDALLTYDSGGGAFVSVALVGAAGEIASSAIHSGMITLG